MQDTPKRGLSAAAIVAMVRGDEANFLAAKNPEGSGIIAQEKQGQISLCTSDHLPVKMDPKTLFALRAAGVVLGEVVTNDPIFMHATLPPGWRKVSTDHSMHSDLVDDKGRKRFSIFYKAAFYDRNADISAISRYVPQHIHCDKDGKPVRGKPTHSVFHVVDQADDSVLYSVGPIEYGMWDVMDAKEAEAIAWLDANFSDWKNPAAYWD